MFDILIYYLKSSKIIISNTLRWPEVKEEALWPPPVEAAERRENDNGSGCYAWLMAVCEKI